MNKYGAFMETKTCPSATLLMSWWPWIKHRTLQ